MISARRSYGVHAEVDNALSARQELTRQVDLSQRSFNAAVEVERLYEVRYRAGATPLRQWLDAQRRGASQSSRWRRRGSISCRTDSRLFQALGGSAQ